MGQNKSKTADHLRVVTPGGEEIRVHLCDTEKQFKTMTVKQLKEKIEQNTAASSGCSADLRLICGDQRLEGDSKLLCEHGVTRESVIQMVDKVEGGKSEEKKDDDGFSNNKGQAGTSAGVVEPSEGERMVKIQVLVPDFSEKLVIDLCNTKDMKKITVKHLKEKIEQNLCQLKGRRVRLSKVGFNGKELEEDSSLLTDHGIQHMSTVEADADYAQIEATGELCEVKEYQFDKKCLSLEFLANFEEPCDVLKAQAASTSESAPSQHEKHLEDGDTMNPDEQQQTQSVDDDVFQPESVSSA